MSADLQFKQLIDRVLRCREAEDAAKEDTKQVYADAKAKGFDKTAMGALVAELRKKDKNPEKFEERNSILDLYRDAYERASHAHTREGIQSVPATPPVPSPLAALVADESAAPILPDPHSKGLTAGGPNPSLDADGAKSDGPPVAGQGGHEPVHQNIESGQQSASAAQDDNPVVSASGASATISDAEVPAFLKKDHPVKTARDYRPHCQNPEACASSGLHHCYTCAKALAAESEAA